MRSTAAEALALSEELLTDIELSRIPLSNAFLKATRLARILGDTESLQIMRWEVSGYPSNPDGVPREAWRLAGIAGRQYSIKDPKTGESHTRCYVQSIDELEAMLRSSELRLKLTEVPSVSISSANPSQFVHAPLPNIPERNSAQEQIQQATKRLASRRSFVFEYVLEKHSELRVSSPAEDIFQGYFSIIEGTLSAVIPEELIKIDSISQNLESSNPEDWSNAAHSCRRLLQSLADSLFPPKGDETRSGKKVKLGPDNYINRLVCFCEDSSKSSVYNQIVGSSLQFIGSRLDAVFSGAQKGSHAKVSKEEARRIVIYTFMCVGDIAQLAASLRTSPSPIENRDHSADDFPVAPDASNSEGKLLPSEPMDGE